MEAAAFVEGVGTLCEANVVLVKEDDTLSEANAALVELSCITIVLLEEVVKILSDATALDDLQDTKSGSCVAKVNIYIDKDSLCTFTWVVSALIPSPFIEIRFVVTLFA